MKKENKNMQELTVEEMDEVIGGFSLKRRKPIRKDVISGPFIEEESDRKTIHSLLKEDDSKEIFTGLV